MSTESNVSKLVSQIRKDELGSSWAEWPGGWPGQAEAAIIDSVCSVQARYGGPTNGVRGQITAWKAHRGVERLDDIAQLTDFAEWNEARHSPDRPLAQKLGGRLKAEVISDVAGRFVEQDIRCAADLLASDVAESVWMNTPGLGYATWRYVLLLLGVPTVKPDTMLTRYVGRAVESTRSLSQSDVVNVVEAAANELGVEAHLLDHAIWSYERKRRSSSRSPQTT